MEELKKLEDAQSMLSLMEAHGIHFPTDGDPKLQRFVADVLVFLALPYSGVDASQKCKMMNSFPKISVGFLEDASRLVEQNCFSPRQTSSNQAIVSSALDVKEEFPCEMSHSNVAAVTLDAMQRANSSLEDFCRSYFMFHGLDASEPHSIFKYLPVLSFAESYIYQLDALNERMVDVLLKNVMSSVTDHEDVKFSLFGPLVTKLESCGLMTKRIRNELQNGEDYWRLERKLCSAVSRKKEISISDVLTAIHSKSFDYRVLNLLLYELQARKVNDQHMEFLSVSEFLVEISDDLFDYEDDVLENNFNVLRMFVYIYGVITAPKMLAKCIADAETNYVRLLEVLDPHLSLKYQKRCEEATKEGGKFLGPPLGSWTIPPVIADEELFRFEHNTL